jgi:hypothetical protein
MCVEEDPWHALEGHPFLHVGDELGDPYDEGHVREHSSCGTFLSLRWPQCHLGENAMDAVFYLHHSRGEDALHAGSLGLR